MGKNCLGLLALVTTRPSWPNGLKLLAVVGSWPSGSDSLGLLALMGTWPSGTICFGSTTTFSKREAFSHLLEVFFMWDTFEGRSSGVPSRFCSWYAPLFSWPAIRNGPSQLALLEITKNSNWKLVPKL